MKMRKIPGVGWKIKSYSIILKKTIKKETKKCYKCVQSVMKILLGSGAGVVRAGGVSLDEQMIGGGGAKPDGFSAEDYLKCRVDIKTDRICCIAYKLAS